MEKEKVEIKKLKFQINTYEVNINDLSYLISIQHNNNLIREVEILLTNGKIKIPAMPLKALMLLIQQEGFKL
jgi:hypothetical protein